MTIKSVLVLIVCWQMMLANAQPDKPEPPEVEMLELTFYWPPTSITEEETVNDLFQRHETARANFENYLIHHRGIPAFLVLGMEAYRFDEDGRKLPVSGETSNCQINPNWAFFREATRAEISEATNENFAGRYWPNLFYRDQGQVQGFVALYQFEWVMIF